MTETRLIIVDDDALLRMDLRELLQQSGYQVVAEAADARSAIRLTREWRPDLVIMDVRMDGTLDGVDAAEAITEERLAPVLLLTGFSDQPLVARATAAGVAGYLLKPLNARSLRPAIELALARYRAAQVLADEAGALREELATRKVVERAKNVLMQRYRLSEPDAARRIQQTSQAADKPLRAVAEAILLAQQVG
jgi:AmiR/NasT family two-component response regulator